MDMHTLKKICETLTHLAEKVWLFPQTVANTLRHRQAGSVVDAFETERLDRLRNPSNY